MYQESLTEKVSVNMNTATLSQIDLLVDNGYFSNRSDFINQAVRQHLDEQRSTIDRIVEDNRRMAECTWFIGVYCVNGKELKKLQEAGERTSIDGYGLLLFDSSCTEALVKETVEKIRVRGRVVCSRELKDHYGLK